MIQSRWHFEVHHALLKAILVLALLAPLAGCMASDVRKMGVADSADKSITIPPGGNGLLGPIKDSLQKAGWSVKVLAGPEMTIGRFGQQTSLATYTTYNTRYVLKLSQSRFDTCVVGGAALIYDLSIIDLKAGGELLIMNGRDCLNSIIEQINKALATS
jgi:hypothetical protein